MSAIPALMMKASGDTLVPDEAESRLIVGPKGLELGDIRLIMIGHMGIVTQLRCRFAPEIL